MKTFVLGLRTVVWVCSLLLTHLEAQNQETLVVGSYNVDNYRIEPSERRAAKAESAREAVRQQILGARADILALQELGSIRALEGLRLSLARKGLEYPHQAVLFVEGAEIHTGVLSRFPIVADRSEPLAEFVLYGRAFSVLRGILEVDIDVSESYRLTLINLHLKSQLPVWFADQADFRLAEAELVRQRVDRLLNRDPGVNLVVVGDFNDHPKSAPLRVLLGRGRGRMWDCRPATAAVEVGALKLSAENGPGIAWTHYYEREDSYFRYDYILTNAGIRREWVPNGGEIIHRADWHRASDHRLIIAQFFPEDK